MSSLLKSIAESPGAVRAAPFLVFLALTFCQGKFGEASHYWLYLMKTLVGLAMIWWMWPHVPEMRWRFSWEALVVGIVVFTIWVGLDDYYPQMKPIDLWSPGAHFTGSGLPWLFIAVRVLGSTLIVPPLEEVFYRSFLYRYIAKADFLSVPLGAFRWVPLLVTALIFGFAHYQWLSGILCALAYQGLVCRKKRLGDAMTAHAVTNLLLGLWVIWKGAWEFW